MNTDLHAKTAILSWIRFRKRWCYAATEVEIGRGFRADVLASDGEQLIEFEVKTNLDDIKRDFSKKVDKHAKYCPGEVTQLDSMKFDRDGIVWEVQELWSGTFEWKAYYTNCGREICKESDYKKYKSADEAFNAMKVAMESFNGVPNSLVYVVHESIAEEAKKLIPEQYGILSFKDQRYDNITLVRKGKRLNSNKVSSSILNIICLRMLSELANFHIYNTSRYVTRSILDYANALDNHDLYE